MREIRRTISLRDFKTYQEGILYGEFVKPYIYLAVDLWQSGDDMGIFTDLDVSGSNSQCLQFNATTYVSNITCYEGQNPPAEGSITVIPYGGQAPYTYLWNGVEGTSSMNDLPPITYTILITDANGCTASTVATVVATEGADPNVMVNSTQQINGTYDQLPANNQLPNPIVLCDGQTLTFEAESDFNSYIWVDEFGNTVASGTEGLTVDTSGTYHVVVVTPDGCYGESYPVSVVYVESTPPVIEVLNLPTYATGSGTESDPYVICNPHETTQGFLNFGVVNPTAYDWWKWDSGTQTASPTTTVESVGCTVLNPCSQYVQTSNICSEETGTPQDLQTSNTIWFAYVTNFIQCEAIGLPSDLPPDN